MKSLLHALRRGLLFALTFAPTVALAQDAAPIQLPASPSAILQAPLDRLEPLLGEVAQRLVEREAKFAALSAAEQAELSIQQAVLAQVSRNWSAAKQAVERARGLQTSGGGKHLAGLLNELLAQKALQAGDSAWLRGAVRERCLSMPWDDVGASLRAMRQQLADMSLEGVWNYVTGRMDVSADVAKGKVNLGFVMQLLAVRVQVEQVIPNRAALLVGLDDVLASRPAESN